MTNDELEEKIYEIRKSGLEHIIQHSKIKSLLIQNNQSKYERLIQEMNERAVKNIRHLARCNKIPFSEDNFNKFTGHVSSFKELREFMACREMSIYIPMIASFMYNFPVDMILFHDLEIYDEKNIKENFPNSFRDYFSQTSFR